MRRWAVANFLTVELGVRLQPAELVERFDSLRAALTEAPEGPVGLLVDARGFDFTSFRTEHARVARAALSDLRQTLRGRYVAEAFVHEHAPSRLIAAASQRAFGLAKRSRTFASVAEAEEWLQSQ